MTLPSPTAPPSDPIRVLALCGSLRAKSYNRALLRAAIELAPPGMLIETGEFRDFPLYDHDIYEQGFPPPVQELRRRIAAADGVLIVSPEYNFSVPGGLKNAIDWVSRGPDQPFDGKPLGIMGASAGNVGTARMQYHLRQIAIFVNMFPMNKPEVFVGRVQEKFDANGVLTDEATRSVLVTFLSAFEDWVRRMMPRARGQAK